MKQEKLKLDFSGGPNSWFDLWHTHFDWKGEGNKKWEVRKKYLDELKNFYEQVKGELASYPKEYQLWISIDEQESGDDAVYIHTANPNADNFPISVENKKPIFKNTKLERYIQDWGLEMVQVDYIGGRMFYLYENQVGKSIVK